MCPSQQFHKLRSKKKDGINFKSAWDELPVSVLQKSWTKLLNWDDKDYDDDDNIPLEQLMSSNKLYDETIQETQHLLLNLGNTGDLSIRDVEDWNLDTFDESDDVSGGESDHGQNEATENDDVYGYVPPVSYASALNAVNTLIEWSEKKAEFVDKHLPNLFELRSDIVKQHVAVAKPKKQMTLNDYFASGA